MRSEITIYDAQQYNVNFRLVARQIEIPWARFTITHKVENNEGIVSLFGISKELLEKLQAQISVALLQLESHQAKEVSSGQPDEEIPF